MQKLKSPVLRVKLSKIHSWKLGVGQKTVLTRFAIAMISALDLCPLGSFAFLLVLTLFRNKMTCVTQSLIISLAIW